MNYAEHDIYSLEDAIAFGVRPSLTMDDSESWEVYVKLISGNRITYAKDGTLTEARQCLAKMVNNALHESDKTLIGTVDDTFVDARFVVRIYLDAQVDDYATLVEDIVGEAHRIATGTREECIDRFNDAAYIIAYLRGDETVTGHNNEDDTPRNGVVA